MSRKAAILRRLGYAIEWGVFLMFLGLADGATWIQAAIYGGVSGGLIGFLIRRHLLGGILWLVQQARVSDGQARIPGDSMRPLTNLQALWALLLVGQAATWLRSGGDELVGLGWLQLGCLAIYLVLIVALHRRSRWAWWLCWIPPVASWVLWGPRIVYNLALMHWGHPLFYDSPGTGLVVYVLALEFLVLPLCIMAMLLVMRRRLVSD